ncbi:MAG: hypothetical protein QCH31_10385 [Methanolobus sp.]|nr:hypothetical protein [Methanolobus sp.]
MDEKRIQVLISQRQKTTPLQVAQSIITAQQDRSLKQHIYCF